MSEQRPNPVGDVRTVCDTHSELTVLKVVAGYLYEKGKLAEAAATLRAVESLKKG